MSNLETAKAAIEAELAHVRQGLAFYHSRIESLEKTLLQLAGIGSASINAAAPVSGKRRQKVGAAKQAKAAKLSKTGKKIKSAKAAAGGNALPFTGGDYWTNLVTSQPQSASEILNGAIAGLGFTPTKAQVQKLAGRQTFAINALVKANKIQDSGKGRDRRFFKA